MSDEELEPHRLMKIGAGFRASKLLMTAVDFGLYTYLGDGPKRASEIEEHLELHPRATRDFLDALLSLGFLQREGDGDDPLYSNTPETKAFLDANSPRYVGAVLEMFNHRLYEFWGDLDEALRTGKPQSELKDGGDSYFERLYDDPDRLEEFMEAMSGASDWKFSALAETFDFSGYETLTDVGGALGDLSRIVASEWPHLECTSFDLPAVTELAEKHLHGSQVADRIELVSGSYFDDPIPPADVVTASLILHDLNLPDKMHFLEKAYEAVRPGGAFIAIDNIIDDARRTNTGGLLMSLTMLIEFGDAFDYTGAQITEWAKEAGFDDVELRHLSGSARAAIAWKH